MCHPRRQVVCLTVALAVTGGGYLRGQWLSVPAFGSEQTQAGLAQDSQRVGAITGRVVESSANSPVAGARVTRWQVGGSDRAQYEVVTDSQGRFLFRGVAAGSWRVVAETPGYEAGAYGRRRPNGPDRLVDVSPGKTTTDIAIQVFPSGGVLSGTVTDEDGTGVVGSPVRAIRRAAAGEQGHSVLAAWPAPAITNDRGEYRFVLPSGDYAVLVLPPTAITGVPIATSGGQAESGGNQAPARQGSAAPSGWADGFAVSFGNPPRLDLLPAFDVSGITQTYEITANPSFLDDLTTFVRLDDGREHPGVDLRVRRVPAHRLSGRLIASGTALSGPVEGVQLRLEPAFVGALTANTGFDVAATTTGVNGAFTLLGVPSGRYILETVENAGARGPAPARVAESIGPTGPSYWARLEVSVGGGDLDGLDVTLERGASATGRVVFGGSGRAPAPSTLSGISVSLLPFDGPARQVRVSKVDEAGHFTTAEYPTGQYVVSATVPPGWVLESVTYRDKDVSVEPLEVKSTDIDGVVLTLSDSPGTLSGVVRNGANAVDPDATVLAFAVNIGSRQGFGSPVHRLGEARVGADGRYALRPMPAGDYFIVAVDDALAGQWRQNANLRELTRVASRVTLHAGQGEVLDLRTQSIRWSK